MTLLGEPEAGAGTDADPFNAPLRAGIVSNEINDGTMVALFFGIEPITLLGNKWYQTDVKIQTAFDCSTSPTISPTSSSITSSGGTRTITVTSPADCTSTAVSEVPWITVTDNAIATGSHTVTLSIASNGGADRTGTVTVGEQTYTLTQTAVGCTAPTITQHPVSQTIANGQSTTLSVAATGTGPLSYRWYFGASGNTSQPISEATSPELTVTRMNASYWVQITNSCGVTNSASAAITVAPSTIRQKTPADFDGDGTSDFVVYRNGTWVAYNQFQSAAPLWSVTTGAISGGIPLPMDYNGDGRTDFTVYQPSSTTWFFYNANGSFLKSIAITGGGTPAPADYDGDGTDDIVVYRTSGNWVAYDFNNGSVRWTVPTYPWGNGNGIPMPMDYDGDGKAEFTVFFSGGPWYLFNDDGSYRNGICTCVPGEIAMPGDYDGDGVEEMVVWRFDTWKWFDVNTAANYKNVNTGAGSYNGDPIQPANLDYDGDKALDFSVFASGPWYVFLDNGSLRNGTWAGGAPGDLALSRRDKWQSTPP